MTAAVEEELLVDELRLPRRLSSRSGACTMRPEVEPGLGVHKGHRQVTSCHKQGRVDVWGRIHRVADCQSTLLDAMGEELAVFPVNLRRGDTQGGQGGNSFKFPSPGAERRGQRQRPHAGRTAIHSEGRT